MLWVRFLVSERDELDGDGPLFVENVWAELCDEGVECAGGSREGVDVAHRERER